VAESYFLRVRAETPTRLWINNPTLEEVDLALAQGAMGSTTNPSYGGNLLRRVPDYVKPVIAEAVADAPPSEGDLHLADRVQERLVRRILAKFQPLWEASAGTEGFVSIQGSPESDHDGARITEEAHRARTLGPNATPKIPATLPGFRAFEEMVADNSPTIVTEVFSLDQVAYACELYNRVTDATGHRPPFIMSPITGIFADHLKKLAKRDGIAVDSATVDWTGVALGRACRRLVRERSYPVMLLFGGARVPIDYTGLVGEWTAATINYSTVAEILKADPPVQHTINDPVDPAILQTLSQHFNDFARGMTLGSLSPEEFEGFGPVQHFRDAFMEGWHAVLAEIRAQRAARAVSVDASAAGEVAAR
jgi:transaldolase